MDKRCQGLSFYCPQLHPRFGISSGDLTFSPNQCLAKVPHKEYVVPYPNHVNYTLDVPLDKNSSMFDGVCASPPVVSLGTRAILRPVQTLVSSTWISIRLYVTSVLSIPERSWIITLSRSCLGFGLPDPLHRSLFTLAPFVRS